MYSIVSVTSFNEWAKARSLVRACSPQERTECANSIFIACYDNRTECSQLCGRNLILRAFSAFRVRTDLYNIIGYRGIA